MLTRQTHKLIRTLLGALLLLVLSTGCDRLPLYSRQLSEVDLSIQVGETNRPGVYAITGKANLPDRTQITVAALRYLYPGTPAAATLNPDPTYSILGYQLVQVNQGEWQTDLNLWQVSPEGEWQEAWQMEQSRLQLSLKPANDVVFLATLTPIDRLSNLEQQLAGQRRRLARGLVRSSADGQRYAQVEELMAIALPSGRTTPPAARPDDENYGWGRRYLIPQEPQNPYELEFPDSRQTNAPAAPDEFLR